jgi:hypothetical protein
VAQYVLAASQTYAGINTQLNAYGGTWTGTWPTGRGTTEYDFWTPLIVNFGSTSFTASPNNDWAHSGHDAMRYAIIKSRRNKSVDGQLDVLMIDDEMFRQYLGVLDTKERIIVQKNAQQSTLVKLGFSDVVNLDGTDISWEYGSPPNVGYGWNFSEFEARSLQEQLFEPDGPDYDIGTRSYRFAIDALGNFVINPKFQVKLISQAHLTARGSTARRPSPASADGPWTNSCRRRASRTMTWSTSSSAAPPSCTREPLPVPPTSSMPATN